MGAFDYSVGTGIADLVNVMKDLLKEIRVISKFIRREAEAKNQHEQGDVQGTEFFFGNEE